MLPSSGGVHTQPPSRSHGRASRRPYERSGKASKQGKGFASLPLSEIDISTLAILLWACRLARESQALCKPKLKLTRILPNALKPVQHEEIIMGKNLEGTKKEVSCPR